MSTAFLLSDLLLAIIDVLWSQKVGVELLQ